MEYLDMHINRLRSLLEEATENLIPLYTIGGSNILIQEDDEEQDPSKKYYAAVVVLMDYGSTPEQAIQNLVAKVKVQVHGEKKEDEEPLPAAGEEEPRER